MLCQWCGMKSTSDTVCSWCGRQLTAPSPEASTETPPEAPSSGKPTTDLNASPASTSPDTASAPFFTPSMPWRADEETTESDAAPFTAPGPVFGIVPPPDRLGPAQEDWAPAPPQPLNRDLADAAGDSLASPADVFYPPRQEAPFAPADPGSMNPVSFDQSAAPFAPADPGSMNPALFDQPAPRLSPFESDVRRAAEETGGLAGGVSAEQAFGAQAESHSHIATPAEGAQQIASAPAAELSGVVSSSQEPTTAAAPPVRPRRHMATREERRAAAAGKVKLRWDDVWHTNLGVVGRWAAVFAGILAVAAGLTHAHPNLLIISLVVAQFVGAMIMPVIGATPFADEDSDYVAMGFMMLAVLNPAVALISYISISFMRQDYNPSVIGFMAVALFSRGVLEIAAGKFHFLGYLPLAQFTDFGWAALGVNFSWLFAIAGWYGAAVFRKLDE